MRMCPFSLDRDAQVTAGRRGAKGALGAVQREQLDALGLVWDMRERRDTVIATHVRHSVRRS